ncbi:MAG: hypothetical protein ACK5TA_09540, partial [bacterium]
PREGIYNTCIKWRAEFTYADGKKLIFATPNEAPGQKSVLVHGEDGWVCADRRSIDAENKSLLKQRPELTPGGTLPVYGPLKVRGFGFIDSGCHLLVNLLSERRPEAAA